MSRKLGVDTDEMPDMTPEGLRHTNPRAREIGNHVYDFDSASRFLGDKPERRLAANTKIFYMLQSRYYGNETIAVKFHQTIIVQYMQGGIIELNTGGHHTVTTKQRINQLLPPGFRVEQRNYEWLLHTPSGTHGFADSMKVSTVSGNVKYHEAGRVTPQVPALPGMTPLGMRPKGQGYASNPPRGQGKFRNDLEEVLYHLTLEGADGEYGEVDGYGYHASLLANVGGADLRRAVNELGQDPASALHDLHGDGVTFPINAIVGVDSQGFVDVSYFDSEQEARVVFEQGENDYSDWLGEVGYDGN